MLVDLETSGAVAARPLVPGLSGARQACHHSSQAGRAFQDADTKVNLFIGSGLLLFNLNLKKNPKQLLMTTFCQY